MNHDQPIQLSEPISITLVIPCYNEEFHIEHTLRQITSHLLEYPTFSFQILVLDDCSTDSSLVILNQIAKNNPVDITILRNESNKGIVTSTKRLLQTALSLGPHYILKCDMDTDVPHKMAISMFLELIEQNRSSKIQILIGERFVADQNQLSPLEISEQEKMRVYLMEGLKIKNYNPVSSGTVLFTKNVIEQLLQLPIVISYDMKWGLDFLLCLLAHQLNFPVQKVTITNGNYSPSRRSIAKIKAQYAAYYNVLQLVENCKKLN
ncbi:glycosyltransferase [Maribacter confluentis]|uniref:Glycosyltransferase n=1 Tax=Maribacter confluentis TaxID=1656093 RepID=A0ABT8RLW2_9FLAO|nr:glycosyltransferase [Maribacter confluentis]MDO1511437.1 glycosyltransferase [Maribacter confluentis]